METGLIHAHSGLRYLIFLVLIIVLVKSIMNLAGKKEWAAGDTKLTMILMASTHLQLLLGFIMYLFVFQYYHLMGDMDDPISRWKAVEHMATMVIFVILVSVLHIVNKKPNKKNKNRRALILAISAIITGLSGIPFDRWF